VKRRFQRSRWPEATVVLGLVVLAYVVITGQWGGGGSPEDVIDREPPPTRDFAGVVQGDGKPLAGIRLELFESADGLVGKAVSGDDGAYTIRWTPRTGLNARSLTLVGVDPKKRFVRTAAPVGAEIFEMLPGVDARGIVIGPGGEPQPNALVSVAVHAHPFGGAKTDADGRFVVPGLPNGAPLEIFARGAGLCPTVYRGFRVGEFCVIQAEAGKRVALTVRDPSGRAVPEARVRASVQAPFAAEAPGASPGADGVWRVVAASHATGLVEVRAPGYIPLFVNAPTFGAAEAVLWPDHEVVLRVWDGWENRGVLGIEAEVTLAEGNDNAAWNGADAKLSWREFPLLYGASRGLYTIRLPRCPVTLSLSASGYADSTFDLSGDATEKLVRMPPLQKRKVAHLKIRAPRLTEPHWMVVADEEERWYSAFMIRDGEGRVRVPARRPLELASACAEGGLWLPRIKVEAIAPNKTRVIDDPALAPAAQLLVTLDPPTPCDLTLVDKTFGKAVPPIRIRNAITARFWVRPKREVSVTIEPKGNFREHTGEFEVEPPRREWTAFLRAAAGFSMRVRDEGGRPVAFADVAVWEALRAGRANLRGPPRRYRTDATGAVTVVGLRDGPTPVEVSAAGFMSLRPKPLEFVEGKVLDRGTLKMLRARLLRGRVSDPDGKPLAGVLVRTIGRGLRRLELPGGGARDLYDLTGQEEADATSDEKGRFVVRDRAPRLPLVVFEHPDYATTVADPEQGELDVRMGRAAQLSMSLPSGSPVEGVYLLLSRTRAVRVHTLGGLSLNPLPLTLPAGRAELFVRLRNRRWAAPIIELRPGEQRLSVTKLEAPR
jgi:hypothetical protein